MAADFSNVSINMYIHFSKTLFLPLYILLASESIRHHIVFFFVFMQKLTSVDHLTRVSSRKS